MTLTLRSCLKISVWTQKFMTTRTEWMKNSCCRTRRFTTIPTELASLYKHGVTNFSTSKWCNNNLFLFDRYKVHKYLLPAQEAIMRKHFGSSPPSVTEAERNMSLLLLTSNSVFNYPIPLPPSVVSIHSLHIKTAPDPLPEVRNSLLSSFTKYDARVGKGSNILCHDISSYIDPSISINLHT